MSYLPAEIHKQYQKLTKIFKKLNETHTPKEIEKIVMKSYTEDKSNNFGGFHIYLAVCVTVFLLLIIFIFLIFYPRTRKHLTKYILNRSLEEDFEDTNSSPGIVLRHITPDLPSSWSQPSSMAQREQGINGIF